MAELKTLVETPTTLTAEQMSDLRKAAESHLDKAQAALFDDSIADEDALSSLDDALACLNTMIAG